MDYDVLKTWIRQCYLRPNIMKEYPGIWIDPDTSIFKDWLLEESLDFIIEKNYHPFETWDRKYCWSNTSVSLGIHTPHDLPTKLFHELKVAKLRNYEWLKELKSKEDAILELLKAKARLLEKEISHDKNDLG